MHVLKIRFGFSETFCDIAEWIEACIMDMQLWFPGPSVLHIADVFHNRPMKMPYI